MALKRANGRARGAVQRFSPFAGLHLNGKQTLGENIADLTGASVAYRANLQTVPRQEMWSSTASRATSASFSPGCTLGAGKRHSISSNTATTPPHLIE